MTRINNLYEAVMDRVNRLIEDNDNQPDFDAFFEHQTCLYCQNDTLYLAMKKTAIVRVNICDCPSCQKKGGIANNMQSSERHLKESSRKINNSDGQK